MLKLNQYFSGKGIHLCPAEKEPRERGTIKEQDTEEFSEKRGERESKSMRFFLIKVLFPVCHTK